MNTTNTTRRWAAIGTAAALLTVVGGSGGALAQEKKTEKKETVKTPRVSFKGVGTRKIGNAFVTAGKKIKGTVVKEEKKPAAKPTRKAKPKG